MFESLLVTIMLLITMSSSAASEDMEKGPCAIEAKRLCAGVEPGRRRIAKCLREKRDQVSQECRDKIKDRKEKRKDRVMEACAADIEKSCKDLKPGSGLYRCLRKNSENLSESCRQSMRTKKERKRDKAVTEE